MTSPNDVTLRWNHGMADGVVKSAYARVTLTSPIADSSEQLSVISLDINPDDDGFQCSAYHGDEEDVPFNEGVSTGSAPNLVLAKQDGWAAVCKVLTNLGYTDGEIAESISQPAGSLTLDLDEWDDNDE